MTKYSVGVAAEAYAAALLAHGGLDVSIQYGANRPGYDIVAIKDDKKWRVSVKGSQDNGWMLASKSEGQTYHAAIDEWLLGQKDVDVFIFVQFCGGHDTATDKPFLVPLGTMPGIYVATPKEVADVLKAQRNGEGQMALAVYSEWRRGVAKGTTDRIPDSWTLTNQKTLPL